LKGLLDRPKTPLRKRAPTVRKKYELDIIRIRNNNPTWSKEKIAIERYQRISELKNRTSLPRFQRLPKAPRNAFSTLERWYRILLMAWHTYRGSIRKQARTM